MEEVTKESLDDFGSGFQRATLDTKGRILLNKTIRGALKESFILNWGEVGQIEAYSLEAWKSLRAQTDKFDELGSSARMYNRLRFGRHVQVKLDPQGRLVIPSELRACAKITKEVIIISGTKYYEIWSPTEYDLAEQDPLNYMKSRR